jgi:radical SAM protein with 4Fe4S-binding SPASM domain
MFDINFFQHTKELKQKIVNHTYTKKDMEIIFKNLTILKNPKPKVFNVETSNYCNMRCIMCPRTTAMTRKVQTIDDLDFEKVIHQIEPHTKEEIKQFLTFVEEEYGINELSRSENAFYFYVSSTCLTLHGYGEPLIDPNIVNRVILCNKYNIPTYFSCVPANIDIVKIIQLMQAGLDVIKFSIDSLDDMEAKEIRGKQNNYTQAYQKIQEILKQKKELGLKTLVVCTMLDLSTDESSLTKQNHFLEIFANQDVFAYVKSLDNRWYNDLDEALQNKSHYESQYCEFPWTSLTIMSNGDVVPCTQDYNNEMVFGNIKENSLEDIWNSSAYEKFRSWHINGNFPTGYKCNERCDIKKIYHYLKEDV